MIARRRSNRKESYIGIRPSKAIVQSICRKISGMTLIRAMIYWANYLSVHSLQFQSPSFQYRLPHHQVAQSTGHYLTMSVLRQPTIANLGKAELVFHLRPPPGLIAVLQTLRLRQLAVARTLFLGEILRIWCHLQDHGLLTRIGRIPPYRRLVAMQKIRQNPRIEDIGRRGDYRMNQLAATVHADMRLHAEVPLLAIARQVHLRVPFLLPVLRRTAHQ